MKEVSWVVLATIADSWRSLVKPISYGDHDSTLSRCNGDYEVVLKPVHVYDEFQGKFVEVSDRYCTGRVVRDASSSKGHRLESWEVVKDRYVVVPNRDILQRAEQIVDAYNGKAALDGCGVLDGGRKFFVSIATGSLEILSSGRIDHIDSYLIAMTSHDGSIPICYYSLDVRRKTNSVYRFNHSDYDFTLRKRHTPNHGDNSIEISEAINLRTQWTTALKSVMNSFLRPISDQDFDRVLSSEWDVDNAGSKSKREHIESVLNTINDLYKSDHNVGMFGHSKWAAFNAICEYIDFHRNIKSIEAAQHSIEIDNYSHRLKVSLFNELSNTK